MEPRAADRHRWEVVKPPIVFLQQALEDKALDFLNRYRSSSLEGWVWSACACMRATAILASFFNCVQCSCVMFSSWWAQKGVITFSIPWKSRSLWNVPSSKLASAYMICTLNFVTDAISTASHCDELTCVSLHVVQLVYTDISSTIAVFLDGIGKKITLCLRWRAVCFTSWTCKSVIKVGNAEEDKGKNYHQHVQIFPFRPWSCES